MWDVFMSLLKKGTSKVDVPDRLLCFILSVSAF